MSYKINHPTTPRPNSTPTFFAIFANMKELFTISKLEAARASEIANTPNDPHIHEFEELLVGVQGKLEHLIDFRKDIYTAPYVSFIAKGKTHRLKPILHEGLCSIWVIKFQTDFLPGSSFGLYALYHDAANLEIADNAVAERINTLCGMMYSEFTAENPSMNVIRDLLKVVFTMVEAEREKAGNSSRKLSGQNTTFKNFLAILEENYRRPDAGVEFYAEKLFMSSRNLNIICNNIISMNVSDIIENRRMSEGKNMLSYTDKTISEIGYEIGYNDKSCFTNAFKKHSGVTPTQFRSMMKSLI